MMAVMAQVVDDAKSFGITDDQINRAVYRWVMERMIGGPTPFWYFDELDEIDRITRQQGGPME